VVYTSALGVLGLYTSARRVLGVSRIVCVN